MATNIELNKICFLNTAICQSQKPGQMHNNSLGKINAVPQCDFIYAFVESQSEKCFK
jgi:hypothetical protein